LDILFSGIIIMIKNNCKLCSMDGSKSTYLSVRYNYTLFCHFFISHIFINGMSKFFVVRICLADQQGILALPTNLPNLFFLKIIRYKSHNVSWTLYYLKYPNICAFLWWGFFSILLILVHFYLIFFFIF